MKKLFNLVKEATKRVVNKVKTFFTKKEEVVSLEVETEEITTEKIKTILTSKKTEKVCLSIATPIATIILIIVTVGTVNLTKDLMASKIKVLQPLRHKKVIK